MSARVDFVEYGGHTIRRVLAEDVERRVQAHRDTVRIYHVMLEYAREGLGGVDGYSSKIHRRRDLCRG